jgi:hypothetical protein
MSQGRYVSGELVRSVYVVNMSSGGGSGTPGGSDTQIQFNNAGVFGGVANSSVNNATGNITLGNRVSVPLGTAALPSIYPGTDTNTGIYSPGADQVAVATNGVGRVFVDASGNVGVGTASPAAKLHVVTSGAGEIRHADGTRAVSMGSTGTVSYIGSITAGQDFALYAANGEKARIDSSGRLLVGASSASGTNTLFESASTTANAANVALVKRNSGSANQAGQRLHFYNFGPAATARAANTEVGSMRFYGSQPTSGGAQEMARITCAADLIQTGLNTSGRLTFFTAANDAASSPTERMRITSDAYVRLAAGTGGIQFNGDTAAANALDDYEEGTWTPQLEFGGATTGITYNARQGYYVKIGKMVFITVYFNLSSKGTATGNSTVTGLPFTSEDFNISGTTSWPGSKAARRQNHTGADFAMAAQDNTATIGISDGAGSALTDTTYTNGTIIECALRYRTAS